MNELPELDELVQVGLSNILEERDVQIRGFPVRFDLDILILFSANPATYNRSGKVIPQLKDRIGSTVQTHYPLDRDLGIEILEQEADVQLDGEYPVTIYDPIVRLRADMSREDISEHQIPPHFTNIQHALQLSRQLLATQETPLRRFTNPK